MASFAGDLESVLLCREVWKHLSPLPRHLAALPGPFPSTHPILPSTAPRWDVHPALLNRSVRHWPLSGTEFGWWGWVLGNLKVVGESGYPSFQRSGLETFLVFFLGYLPPTLYSVWSFKAERHLTRHRACYCISGKVNRSVQVTWFVFCKQIIPKSMAVIYHELKLILFIRQENRKMWDR